MNAAAATHEVLKSYYALHSRLYDATRWSFLFGRDTVIQQATGYIRAQKILEVGCGTGRNLNALRSTFPDASITGLDLSRDMLRIAKKHTRDVHFIQSPYDTPVGGFDLILCSYALSMFNPGWECAIETAAADLNPGGIIAVVDFSHTDCMWFEKWMRRNHVRMQKQLWPLLKSHFISLNETRHPAYLGLWHYGIYIGRHRL